MKISNFTNSLDNNFNLIRIIAAFAVLVTHSFPLALGIGKAEPISNYLSRTIGSIAVDIFFLTSGFLVTASFLSRQSTIQFIWARALRIFPALFVMLVVSVLGLGLFFTTVPLSVYFTDSLTYKYFFKCLTLFSGVSFQLPGVFENNPYKYAVNGSLWSLPHEVKLYALLAFIGLLLRVTVGYRLKLFKIMFISGVLITGVLVGLVHFQIISGDINLLRLYYMFFTGGAFFLFKERIVLSKKMFNLALAFLLVAMFNEHIFFFIYLATIAYILFFFAYVPSGVIRKYNKLGDYSYGVYIYAWPVQQSTAELIPGISVLAMIIISSSITLMLAVISWHLLEKYALKFKGKYGNSPGKSVDWFYPQYGLPTDADI